MSANKPVGTSPSADVMLEPLNEIQAERLPKEWDVSGLSFAIGEEAEEAEVLCRR